MSSKVAVVILGWNGKKFLQQFLPAVVQHSNLPGAEVVYADNASTDDSVPYVQQHFPQVRIVQNTRNGGYAGGYNDALKQIEAEYYVLLNQDVEVTPGWLQPLIAMLDANPQIAAAQPKLLWHAQRDTLEYAGAAGGMLDCLGYPFCRGRIFEALETDHGQYEAAVPIFWASGACLFVRSEAYWNAGALDEDFFAHQEEIDLCWRLQRHGHRVYYCPQSVVYHVGGGTLQRGNPRKTFLNFRNNLALLTKNMPATTLLWLLPLRFLLDVVAALYSCLKNRNAADALAIFRAQWQFYTSFRSWWNKRSVAAHPVSLFPKSVMWQHFVKGKRTLEEMLAPVAGRREA